jgi:hypothetical protein
MIGTFTVMDVDCGVANPVMTQIELSRSIEAYFAFAEIEPNDRGRHFSITFTYLDAGRIDRLQWWWHVNKGQERGGETMLASLKQEAMQRFTQHIDRWLTNSGRRLTGGEPFPVLEARAVEQAAAAPVPATSFAQAG